MLIKNEILNLVAGQIIEQADLGSAMRMIESITSDMIKNYLLVSS
jgi:hypothetical protein